MVQGNTANYTPGGINFSEAEIEGGVSPELQDD